MQIPRLRSALSNSHGPSAIVLVSLLLTSCAQHREVPSATHQPRTQLSDLVCRNAQALRGQSVGNGHCVSLIKHCSGAPPTSQWRPGKKVLSTPSPLPAGTIIATFDGARYPNRHGHHAAIYISHDSTGIWVWDQWLGKPVHKRLIRARNDIADPGNRAQAYHVVKLSQ